MALSRYQTEKKQKKINNKGYSSFIVNSDFSTDYHPQIIVAKHSKVYIGSVSRDSINCSLRKKRKNMLKSQKYHEIIKLIYSED